MFNFKHCPIPTPWIYQKQCRFINGKKNNAVRFRSWAVVASSLFGLLSGGEFGMNCVVCYWFKETLTTSDNHKIKVPNFIKHRQINYGLSCRIIQFHTRTSNIARSFSQKIYLGLNLMFLKEIQRRRKDTKAKKIWFC